MLDESIGFELEPLDYDFHLAFTIILLDYGLVLVHDERDTLQKRRQVGYIIRRR
jgi:hypothetical protein